MKKPRITAHIVDGKIKYYLIDYGLRGYYYLYFRHRYDGNYITLENTFGKVKAYWKYDGSEDSQIYLKAPYMYKDGHQDVLKEFSRRTKIKINDIPEGKVEYIEY